MFSLTMLIVICISATAKPISSKNEVTLTDGPVDFRLYQRNAKNVCQVPLKGSVSGGGKVILKVYDGKNLIDTQQGESPFSFTTKIEAKLTNYRFEVNGVTVADNVVCGDAYIINGQSNAEAFKPYKSNQWVRAFGTSDVRPDSFRNTTWGIALAHKFDGQESKLHHVGCWGLKLADMLVKRFSVPVAIIQGARGGATLVVGKRAHARNDSNPEDPQTQYGRLLWRVRKAGLDKTVKVLLWHQGENSGMVKEEAQNYYDNFNALMDDWKEDYPAMKTIYLFQTRRAGKFGAQVRQAQRQLGAKNDNIHLMSTVGVVGYHGLHFDKEGYIQLAERLFPVVAKYTYGVKPKAAVTAPNIVKATYADAGKTKVILQFDQPVTVEDGVLSGIRLGGQAGLVSSGLAKDNTITLTLSGAPSADTVTYCDDDMKHTPTSPFIRGKNGITALTFLKVPIEMAD